MPPRLNIEPVDLIAVERHARRLQAQAVAEGIRALGGWLRVQLSNLTGARPA